MEDQLYLKHHGKVFHLLCTQHEHLYEPTVFWHTELTSQEWELCIHPSLKKEAHRDFLWKLNDFLLF